MKINSIYTEEPFIEYSNAVVRAREVVQTEQRALASFTGACFSGFTRLWGHRDNPTPREEIVATLNALGASRWEDLAARHAGVMVFLITNELVSDVEPWQLETPYPITVDGDTITVGEELNPSWVLPPEAMIGDDPGLYPGIEPEPDAVVEPDPVV
jgi:hypothetical protein